MSDVQSSSSEDADDYLTCDEDEDEDEDEKSDVPRAASPSSSSSEDGRDPSYYYHTSDEDEEDYHTCDEDEDEDENEDEDEKSDVPRAASPSSSSSEDWRDPSYYYHTSDEDEDEDENLAIKSSAPPITPNNEDGRKQEEEEEELDVLGAAPVVAVRKETRQLHTRSVTGLEQFVQKMLQSCEQPNTQLVPPGSQKADETLAVASGSGLRGCQNTTLNVKLNVTQKQFGDVTVEKANQINQSFGGSQNISRTETINEGQAGRKPSRVEDLMKRTISQFQGWNQGMVRTAALDQVLDKLKSGTTWLTIKGNPGEGKTTVAYMALEDLHGCGREVFEVRSPGEFTEVIETCSSPVIMLDDVFGNLEFDQAEWSKWKPALSPLLKEREHKSHETEDTTSKKDVTVILIGRDYVLNSASVDLGRLVNFLTSEKHVVYMDHTMERSIEEKRTIWETISKSSGVVLDSIKVEEILRISVAHGFPHVCRLFTTIYKDNKSVDAVEFFTKPLTFLNESVSNLFKDTNKLKLFQEMISGEGKISIRELGKLDRTYKIKQTADTLVGTYIKIEEDNYVFDHPSIYDSVAFHMCKLDPEFVIQQCHLSFIHERVRISFSQDSESSNDSGLVVNVNKCYAHDLAERFSAEIMSQNFMYVLSHQAFTDEAFVVLVMERMTKPLQSLLHLTDQSFESWSFIDFVPSSESPELLKYIDNCTDITLTTDDERDILYATCMWTASDVLTYLTNTRKSLDINVRFYCNSTPLLLSAETRDAQFVHQILSLKPDLNVRNHAGETIVHLLIPYELLSPLREVIKRGVDIDAHDHYGKSPLYYACRNNHMEVVKLLVEAGAKLDEKSLHAACEAGNLQNVRLLIEKGVKVDVKSLHSAFEAGNLQIVQFLIKRGANVDHESLHAACEAGNLQIVQCLIDEGVKVDQESLHAACEAGNLQIVHFLIEKGVKIDGESLQAACEAGNLQIVLLLCEKGTDFMNIDFLNRCLSSAIVGGNIDIMHMLVDRGASVNTSLSAYTTKLRE